MNKPNHTPGPWTHQRSGRNSHMMNKPGWNHNDPMQCALSVYGVNYRILTLEDEFPGVRTREEQEANARLIAAAPELLEACKAAQRVIEFFLTTHNTINKAIAKAEGE